VFPQFFFVKLKGGKNEFLWNFFLEERITIGRGEGLIMTLLKRKEVLPVSEKGRSKAHRKVSLVGEVGLLELMCGKGSSLKFEQKRSPSGNRKSKKKKEEEERKK